MFFRIIQHLLPKAKAWRLTPTKQLRQFFEGLTGLGEDVRNYFDLIWLDIFPDTTRQIPEWENQFGLSNTVTDEQERRDRLAATWQALGGQSPRYIQDTLQAAGFNVFVHPWWEEPRTEPPVVRNPLDYLNSGATPVQFLMSDGATEANDGNPDGAYDGASIQPTGFALVNKVFEPVLNTLSDGDVEMNDGAAKAMDGGEVVDYLLKSHIVPNDPTKWPYFLYIGGQVFPNHAIVSESRRNEFETLVLKICPTQQWLGMLIDYT